MFGQGPRRSRAAHSRRCPELGDSPPITPEAGEPSFLASPLLPLSHLSSLSGQLSQGSGPLLGISWVPAVGQELEVY